MTGLRSRVRAAVRVSGVVQGVGFRPFVYTAARRLGLAGHVGNDAGGVFLEIEGEPNPVAEFLVELRENAPPLAEIEDVTVTERTPVGDDIFVIVPSDGGGPKQALVSADSATCSACLGELVDPADPRHSYPFINCTDCGPRFSIVRDVPYDRPNTTMAGFAMCSRCSTEYHDPENRRFHAQPVCCPGCGPRLWLVGAGGQPLVRDEDPVAGAARMLREGHVLAVKGLGGYHVAADATSQRATAELRRRKHREDKPFAVMVSTLEQARELCRVDATAELLLTGHRRPIVLLDRRPGATMADAVAPGNRHLGVMLPYTPLHHLLLDAAARPLVLTSGNVSDEPIAFADEDAFARLGCIVDAFLTHDRPIHIRTDDSVTRPWRGGEVLLRRSRGYVPEPLTVPWEFPRPVLGCGAELKNTFCLASGTRAFCSHHIGDLENYETYRSFTEGVEHFSRLFDIHPEVVAHDLHPEYMSTKHALDLTGVELVGVQHHHAHIASCLADNGQTGPVLGVAFDGTGFGPDGTMWGGEFLLADLAGFERLGHLAPVALPGGAAAIRQPWRMAAVHLGAKPPPLPVFRRNARSWDHVARLAERGVNSPLTSSAGRLFDAVAALLDVRDVINYEGQGAIELEQRADPQESSRYPIVLTDGDPVQWDGTALVRAVADDLRSGADPVRIAARFHNTVAAAIRAVCDVLRDRTGCAKVALSGGVFQNHLLLERSVDLLEQSGFTVLTHSRVPCNDGGISLGQVVVAGVPRVEEGS